MSVSEQYVKAVEVVNMMDRRKETVCIRDRVEGRQSEDSGGSGKYCM